jgi:hypothetical protein
MGILDRLFGKKKKRKRQRKRSGKNTSRQSDQVPRGIHRRGKIDPYAALTAGKAYLKRVTGKDLNEVQEISLITLLGNWKNLSVDPSTTFSDSYVFDIFMIISKWALGKNFRGRMLINSRKERQKYLNPKGDHYAILKGAGIEPVDVMSLFKSEKIRSITKAFDSPDKLILCSVDIYRDLVVRWPEDASLKEAMTKPAIQTINQEELLSQFINEWERDRA